MYHIPSSSPHIRDLEICPARVELDAGVQEESRLVFPEVVLQVEPGIFISLLSNPRLLLFPEVKQTKRYVWIVLVYLAVEAYGLVAGFSVYSTLPFLPLSRLPPSPSSTFSTLPLAVGVSGGVVVVHTSNPRLSSCIFPKSITLSARSMMMGVAQSDEYNDK